MLNINHNHHHHQKSSVRNCFSNPVKYVTGIFHTKKSNPLLENCKRSAEKWEREVSELIIDIQNNVSQYKRAHEEFIKQWGASESPDCDIALAHKEYKELENKIEACNAHNESLKASFRELRGSKMFASYQNAINLAASFVNKYEPLSGRQQISPENWPTNSCTSRLSLVSSTEELSVSGLMNNPRANIGWA